MLSKPNRYDYSANAFNTVSRLRTAKSPTISRIFPLLSSLKHFSKPRSQWTREFRGDQGEKDFVVLLLIRYKGCIYTTSSGKSENLELTSVQNDPYILLDYLGFRHDDTSRNWYFMMDFDLEYTDSEGITKVLPRTAPTKDELLRTVREATRSGTSGFIHIGAHCFYSYPGTSHTKVEGDTTTYWETPKRQSGTKQAYFLSSDGLRVTGEDLQSCLSDSPKVSRKATITMFFDMCHADAFFKDVIDLPCVYTAAQKKVEWKRRTRKQLIAIYGSRAGQVSSSWKDNTDGLSYEYGAATFLTIAFLGDRPSASPVEIVRCLNDICSRRPQENLRQSPYIASRYPIPGRLRLIPGPAAVS